ncbi:MAG: hypothetical protein ACLRMZ_23350 [Blautia marasmi]
MKLYYDRNSKDPTYFIQMGIRNGKKTTTKNVKRIGKHSELLAITDDPFAYAKEQVALFNEEYKKERQISALKLTFPKSFPILLIRPPNLLFLTWVILPCSRSIMTWA